MTTLDVLRAIARRWYLAGLGLVVTVLVGYSLSNVPGVYWTSSDVYLIAPPLLAPGTTSQIGETSDALVSMAGLVERDVNLDAKESNPVSPDVTIVGMGIYNGSLVLLPNAGGQWTYNFDSPRLQVSASSPSAEQTSARLKAKIADVTSVLRQIQARDGVPGARQIKTRLVPEAPPVRYAQGERSRGLAAALFLGLGLTGAACVGVDQVLVTQKGRRHDLEPRREPAAVS